MAMNVLLYDIYILPRCSVDAGEGQESKYVDVHNNFKRGGVSI